MALIRAVAAVFIRPRIWVVLMGTDAMYYLVFAGLFAGLTSSTFSITLYQLIGYANILYFLAPAIKLVVLTIALVRDHLQARPRHWLHWLGVASFATACLFNMARSLIM